MSVEARTATYDTNMGTVKSGETASITGASTSEIAEKPAGRFGLGIAYVPREGDVILSTYAEDGSPKAILRAGQVMRMSRPGDSAQGLEDIDADVIAARKKKESEAAEARAIEMIRKLQAEMPPEDAA